MKFRFGANQEFWNDATEARVATETRETLPAVQAIEAAEIE